jgi:hypothetical protein
MRREIYGRAKTPRSPLAIASGDEEIVCPFGKTEGR